MDTDVVNNSKNKFWSIFVIIFLGAIGSGLWDLFLRDILLNIVSVMISIADYLFVGYADSLYSQIGKGQNNGGFLALLLPTLATLGVIIFPWLFYLKYFHITSINSSFKNNKLAYLFIFFAITINILYSYRYFNTMFNYTAVTYIERSIEIVRPHINETEFIKLRAEYRSIETKKQFSSIYFKIIKIAELNNVKLPNFSPLLIANNKT